MRIISSEFTPSCDFTDGGACLPVRSSNTLFVFGECFLELGTVPRSVRFSCTYLTALNEVRAGHASFAKSHHPFSLQYCASARLRETRDFVGIILSSRLYRVIESSSSTREAKTNTNISWGRSTSVGCSEWTAGNRDMYRRIRVLC